jgi:hypothetical protein
MVKVSSRRREGHHKNTDIFAEPAGSGDHAREIALDRLAVDGQEKDMGYSLRCGPRGDVFGLLA